MALANYTDFVKPYQDGYANGESGGTPVTAEILNTNYDAFLIALNTWAASVGTEIGNKVDKVTGKQLSDENYSSTEKTKLAGIAEGATAVVANPSDSSSTNLTKIKIGGSVYLIPQGGGSGSSVVWTQIQQSGTKIATISIDGTATDVYAPSGGSGGGDSVSWSQVVQSGTKIGTITINNTPTDVYVPTVPTKTSDLTNDSNFVSDASYVHTDNNYTTNEKNKLADLNQVEANPSTGTSAGDLSTISIGGTKYDIPSGGGGGTTVVANPSGVATEELEKLQVGSTIYLIPEGGGSASWTDVTGTLTAGQTSITLSSLYIFTTSTLDFYTDKFGVSPIDAVVIDGSVTLTFEAQSTDLSVKVRITNDEIPSAPLIPTMTSNTLPSGVASASTEFNSSYYAYKAFDGNNSTLWGSSDGQSAGEWIKYDFGYGNEKKLDSVYFRNRSETNYAVGSFKFQGSNDDTNWTDLVEVTGLDTNDNSTVPIPAGYKNTAFRYVRWLIVSNAHASSGTGFVELQVNGWE